MGDSRCSSGGGAWNPSYGGGAWNLSYGGGAHGLCGRASCDPAAMAPSYGPHRLHPAAVVPARHRITPYDPPADARPRIITRSAPIPAKVPVADKFWMDHYYGQDWDEDEEDYNYNNDEDYNYNYDDDNDDDDSSVGEPIKCQICLRESNHSTLNCPFMLITSQPDVLMRTPEVKVSYYFRREEDAKDQCTNDSGFSSYPCQPLDRRNVERCAADAMVLHKDGMNLLRITSLPKDIVEPEQLHALFFEIGHVTNVIVFPDQAIAFVNFVSEEAAQTAIKRFNDSGFGRVMWAMQSPY